MRTPPPSRQAEVGAGVEHQGGSEVSKIALNTSNQGLSKLDHETINTVDVLG